MSNAAFSDGLGTSAVANAVEWVGSVLAGEVATSLAILAIAGLGFTMLTGRLPVRRGMTVIVGCFVLFGAPSIASGLLGTARVADDTAVLEDNITQPAAPLPAPGAQRADDPYAGASIVRRRPH